MQKSTKVQEEEQFNIAQGALTTKEGAKDLAQQLFKYYNKSGTGLLKETEAGEILHDVYRTLQKNFAPSQEEMQQFLKVLDVDGSGQVNILDFERITQKYLVGDAFNFGKGTATK